MQESVKLKNIMPKHDIGSSKQKFQSDDSEGSDLSYQSSLTDQEESHIGRIQFFKEEMARFFINYPELVNKNIIRDGNEENESEQEEAGRKDKMNRNWQSIADQIFNEAKESSTSLQSLAKRISLYRYKIDQSDIIDLLLQQKNVILKQIEAEMAQKKSEKNLIDHNDKQENNADKKFREDNLYYSWRKRKEFQFKINTGKNRILRSQSNNKVQSNGERTMQKVHRSLHKNPSETQLVKKSSKANSIKGENLPINSVLSRGNAKRTQYAAPSEKDETKNLDETQVIHQNGSRLASNWRHLVNFQPKTEIGRQLSEDIKKKNSPSDELGIKKTIIQFLANYKQLINNEVINKVTLSQKIHKIYTEEAKQLLMFYPSKMNTYESNPMTSLNNFKDNVGEDKFIDLLRNISEGPLIKYWRQLQESKI